MTAEESLVNWTRIIQYVRARQPKARIIFFCAHSCTSLDLPARHDHAINFFNGLQTSGAELGIDVVPPLDLPPELTRMPQDRDHFDMRVYRALAGRLFTTVQAGMTL
jgi:hypothetical protein